MIPHASLLKINRLYRQHGPDIGGILQQQYGDFFYVQSILPQIPRLHFILDPADTYRLLVQQKRRLEKPGPIRRMTKSSFGEGLFTSQGDLWRRQRKLIQPAFHHAHLNQYATRIVKHTETMLAQWQDGDIITIGKTMRTLTLTVVLDALFSTDATETNAPVQQAMQDLAEGFAAQSTSTLLFLLPEWFPAPVLNKKRRAAQAIDQIVQQIINDRQQLSDADRPHDLLSTLLFTQDADTGETMTHQQLRDELVTLYFAGHETTALLLSWAWVLLSQHPNIVADLQAELTTVLNGRCPTFQDLPQLALTKAIIQETLRLYPPSWFIVREVAERLEIRDYSIPTGSVLFFVPYTVQRDSRWFDNPQTFQPTRWLTGLEQSLPKGAYFPFGLGPRICIGNGFALMEAQLILATVAQRFHLQQMNEAKTKPAILLEFANPVQMQLSQISKRAS
ncbi:MAG: cytochrome P450 [Chloroflexota bacterium]